MQGSQWRTGSVCIQDRGKPGNRWRERKGDLKTQTNRKRKVNIQVINNTINAVWRKWTLNSHPSKDRNHTTINVRYFLYAHTLILPKGHCKHSLHLQKALNGALEIYAGAASPEGEEFSYRSPTNDLGITEYIPHGGPWKPSQALGSSLTCPKNRMTMIHDH